MSILLSPARCLAVGAGVLAGALLLGATPEADAAVAPTLATSVTLADAAPAVSGDPEHAVTPVSVWSTRGWNPGGPRIGGFPGRRFPGPFPGRGFPDGGFPGPWI